MAEIWAFLTGIIEPLISLISFVFIVWIWSISRFGEHRLYDKWLKQAKSCSGDDDAVLIIDLVDKTDLKAKVLKYLGAHGTLKTIPDEKILSISYDGIAESDLFKLRSEIKQNLKRVQKMGVDKLHLFYAGPVVVATIIGAELVNGIETHVYYLDQAKGYCDWGPVKAPIQH